jgi:hypothetical protein
VLPAWILARVGGQLIESKEDISGDPGWLGVGFLVTDAGLIVLLATIALAFWASRRGGAGWQPRAVGALSSLYLAALAVAWWAMAAKP